MRGLASVLVLMLACGPTAGLRYICGPVASEDLARVPGTRWLIASGLNIGTPAHLYLIDTRGKTSRMMGIEAAADSAHRSECSSPPDLSKMSTDGLAIRAGRDGRHTLYAANHGDRLAIEMFEIDVRGQEPRARWKDCALMPAGTLPNAVTVAADGTLFVVSFHDPNDEQAWDRMARGENTGRVLEWKPGQSVEDVPNGQTSGGNGIELSADGQLIYVSAWSARKIVVLSRRDGSRREISLDFMPDNIHRTADGALLVGGQRTTVEAVHACAGPQCPQPWVVARVDPTNGAVTPLVSGDGTVEINYACGALEAEGNLFITARGDQRIAWLKKPSIAGRLEQESKQSPP